MPDTDQTLPKGFNYLTVATVEQETENATTVVFKVPQELQDEYAFTQGQYLTVMREIDGERLRRPYSLCTAPDENEWRICSKKQPGGRMSGFINDELRAGDEIAVMKPMGRFHMALEPASARSYVAIVSGSGITPVMSIIRTTLDKEPLSRFLLIYGNTSAASIIFREKISDLKNKYLGRLQVANVLSGEESDFALLNGRLTGEKIEELLNKFVEPSAIDGYFICGPEAMMTGAKSVLDEMKIPAERIKIESFGSSNQAVTNESTTNKSNENKTVSATIIIGGERSQVEIPSGGRVLDAVLEADIDVPNSCRSGVCCTCKARLIEGEVEMVANYSLEPDEVANGFILTCQSKPLSDRIVVDYDAL